ncbi:hypothetical protein U27_04245 [Candidatus Vecturithrix granuli]|uniref:Uncharacterized protein n=1 Tax=Vecturithrix granuli TaxID=1499967 RepID=A0A081BY75_VECG1|nr:hypothetical protein U27_04245 [Candidatus Vecturithrix granuli]
MAIESLFTDALAHAGSGIVLALADFVSSRVANPKAGRLERKKQCLVSIDALLDSEPAQQVQTAAESSTNTKQTETPAPPAEERHPIPKDSLEYAKHINVVRNYLTSSGLAKLKLPLFERVKQWFASLIRDEKINGLTNLQKLGVAAGVEVLYDTIFGFHYYTAVLQYSPFATIMVNLYQIPSFWAGLWLGNGLKKFINLLISSSDEKKLDKAIQGLLQRTNIVDVVVNYEAPEQIRNNLLEQGISLSASQLTRVGQSAFAHLKHFATSARDTADDVLNYPQKQAERREQEREDRKKRFDDLTRGR